MELIVLPNKGRGLSAMEYYKPGDRIGSWDYFTFIIPDNKLSQHCSGCAKSHSDEITTLQRCIACKTLCYCNETCQKRDWRVHRNECKRLTRVSPRMPTDTLRLAARCIWSEQNKQVKESFQALGCFEDLTSNYNGLDLVVKNRIAEIIPALKMYMGNRFDAKVSDNAVFMMKVVLRVIINGIEIVNEDMQTVGYGIYLTPSLVNHSCEPNVCFRFDAGRPVLSLQVLAEIKPGDEITVTYVDLLSPLKQRKEQLWNQYMFVCDCPTCTGFSMERNLIAQKCPSCGSTCFPNFLNQTAHFECQSCPCKFPAGETALSTYLDISSIDQLSAVNIREKLKSAQRFLPNFNLQIHNFLIASAESLIQRQLFAEALDFEMLILENLRIYFASFHPLKSLQFAKVGKLLSYLNRIDMAVGMEEEALRHLYVTHGDDSESFKVISRASNADKLEYSALVGKAKESQRNSYVNALTG